MNNKHERKFIINIEIGLILTNSGIFAIINIADPDKHKWDWIYRTIILSLAFNASLLLPGNAFIHKTKADLIGSQNQKMKTDPKAE